MARASSSAAARRATAISPSFAAERPVVKISGVGVSSSSGRISQVSVSTIRRAARRGSVEAARESLLLSAMIFSSSSRQRRACSRSPRCRSPYCPQSSECTMSATESPGSHKARAASKADTLDAETSRHIPRWMKMCDGM